MTKSERKDGKTPNGGDYSVAYYLDGSGNPVDKSKAKQIRIVEYSLNGEIIYTTYGQLG